MQPIQSITQFLDSISKKFCQNTANFLDKNPIIYKVVLVASHFFRAAGMYGFMMVVPFSFPVTCALGIGVALLYRASVERYCCYRFAIPSCLGAGAFSVSKASVIKMLTKKAFRSLKDTVWNMAGMLPLMGYVGYAIYISHTEFEQKRRSSQGSCHRACFNPLQ